MALIEIKNLHASIEGEPILKGVNLTIQPGEVHSIMGRNGSGKSTLTKIIAGYEDYDVTEGEILYNGKDLMELEPEERAGEGIFLCFQYPVEIPGVSTVQFLKAAVNSHRKRRGEGEVDPMSFLKQVREKATALGMDHELLKRSVNEGFSGGEKKRHEILQMTLLEPTLALLDETDSGLDIDALRDVANGVNLMRNSERGFLLVTHYQRLLEYIEPDYVHVMIDGRFVRSGDKSLALELEEKGYGWIEEELTATA